MLNLIFQISLRAIPTVLLIRGVQILLARWLEPRWRFRLWLILIPALMLPVLPVAPFSIYSIPQHFIGAKLSISSATTHGYGALSATVPASLNESAAPVQNPKFAPLSTSPSQNVFTNLWSTLSDPVTGSMIGLLTYAAGVFLVLMLALLQNTGFLREIRYRSHSASEHHIALLEQCRNALGIQTSVELRIMPLLPSPCLVSQLKPRILLPQKLADTLDDLSLQMIFRHELAHLQRYDLMAGWGALALRAIHWFNPFVWYGCKRMQDDLELACDESALAPLSHEHRKAYGRVLLALAESTRPISTPSVACGLLENHSSLKSRIRETVSQRRPTRFGTLSGILVMGMVCAMAISQPPTPTLASSEVQNPALSQISSEGAKAVLKNLPQGWNVLNAVEGDLSKDSRKDVAAVLEGPASAEASAPRKLIILFKKTDGSYVLSAETQKAILKSDEGGVWGDPFSGISINRGSVLVNHYGGSNWRWSNCYRFRFQDGAWYLIGATEKSFNTNTKTDYVRDDYNLLTGNHIHDASDQRGVIQSTTSNRGINPLVKLLNFDPRSEKQQF